MESIAWVEAENKSPPIWGWSIEVKRMVHVEADCVRHNNPPPQSLKKIILNKLIHHCPALIGWLIVAKASEGGGGGAYDRTKRAAPMVGQSNRGRWGEARTATATATAATTAATAKVTGTDNNQLKVAAEETTEGRQ
jgi:hypothetical protein